jgi:hypothetical protein
MVGPIAVHVGLHVAAGDGVFHQVAGPSADVPANLRFGQRRQSVGRANVVDTGSDRSIGVGQGAVEIEEDRSTKAQVA